MAEALVHLFSKPGDIVLDPFCGSGVVPLEVVLAGRSAWANDLNPYAYVITRGKLEAPKNEDEATRKTEILLNKVLHQAPHTDLSNVPAWVREFFHPDTLREVLTAFRILLREEEYFLISCLLGILHHQRPGFLSYPASHLVPYLRKHKFPPENYPEMYEYRDLRTRLLAKVRRAYSRTNLSPHWIKRKHRVWQVNAMSLPHEGKSVDAIISSPPYFGALDYARDSRLKPTWTKSLKIYFHAFRPRALDKPPHRSPFVGNDKADNGSVVV